jgi:LTXXQ motif family protein
MRPWTIPILGAVALSLALPSSADARRFGPGAVLGAVVGAMFGGFRHSVRHHRRSATRPSVRQRSARAARIERRAAVSARRPTASAAPERTAAIFWPDAAADLVGYVFFPKGNERFWAHGYDTIVDAAFAASDADDLRGPRSRPAANQVSDAASPAKGPLSSADLCGGTLAAADANALIERIEQAIAPSASQRDVLEQLRAALAQATERIKATCPAAVPATVTERLNAIQDRIWAMHDALLTVRLPFENFYNSLTDEQQRRLRRDEPDSGEIAANVTDGRAQMCAEPAAGIADGIMRAIERGARPTEQQRAGLEALRLRSAAMAQLIASSCPTHPLPDHTDRFAAVTDRLNVMLFAVMSMNLVLQDFYDSLNEQQKTDLNRALPAGDGTLRSPGPGVGIAPGLGASIPARSASTGRRRVARTGGSEQRAAEVCSNNASDLTGWPIERISEVVQPTDAQRPALDELRAASAKAIDILKSGCPKDKPSIPTGRLAAMESRLQVMLAAVQTVRPVLERFYQLLSDEQKARFNAIAPADDPAAAGKDQRDLTKFCDEKALGVTDLPIERIAQAVQPTPAQRAALDELKDASVKAAEGLKVNCPTYQALTPTGRVEAMEKRLEATLGAVKTVQPALAKFYNSLNDEQKARFNSLRSASRPVG